MNKRIRKKKRKQYNKWLCERYPFLIPRNVWTDKAVWADTPKSAYDWTNLDSMPKGWKKAFGLQMCEDLREELVKYNFLDRYRVVQIKEKYGSLRWYDNGHPVGSRIGEIIADYGYISENVCIGCGKLDVGIITSGWIYPVCRNCFNGTDEEYDKATSGSTDKITDGYTIRSFTSSGHTDEYHDITEKVNKIRARYKTKLPEGDKP